MTDTKQAKRLSLSQAARYLGLPRRHVLYRIRTGDLSAEKIGDWNWTLKMSDLIAAKRAGWYIDSKHVASPE